MKGKMLAFSAYYPPEIAAGMDMLAGVFEAVADSGIDVSVIAPMPSRGVDAETRRLYKARRVECRDNLTIHRVPMIRDGKSLFYRALRYFLIHARFFAKSMVMPADVIFAHSTPPTQGAMTVLVKKIKKVPMIYVVQDLFPDSLVSTRVAKRGSLMWKIGKALAKFTYRNADCIIVISQHFKEKLVADGVDPCKIRVVRNWVDEKAVVDVSRKENVLFDRYSLDRDKFYVTHCGNIGLSQNMDLLLRVAERLKSVDNLHFVIIGDGVCRQHVERTIGERELHNVTLLPYQSAEDIAHVFSLGDAGLVVSKPGVGENSVPSKTWSILAAARPVIASIDTRELHDIIDSVQCGIFASAGNEDALVDAIMQLYSNREICREYGRNGRRFVEENLSREVGVKQYCDIINEIAKK